MAHTFCQPIFHPAVAFLLTPYALLPWSCCCLCHVAQQMCEGLNEALLNANAESASHAVLLSPLSAHEDEVEDNKLASKVLTGAWVTHAQVL